ncbi:MAG: hypothetical protein K1W18_07155 [Oscillospiraceae bacterium]
MAKKIELSKVPAGKSIEVFGKKFTVLEHTNDGVLVLSETVEKEMPFRDGCEARVAPNDFRDSDVHRYLNGEYLDELTDSMAEEYAILVMEMDLKCTFGQREYGSWKVRAGLLTLEQYGKYFDIIPKVDCAWWLATPYGTPLRSPYTGNTCYVWFVYTNGNYYNYNYSGSFGVRPALVLSSSLLVSCDDLSGDVSTQLSGFSDEDLLAEIKGRSRTAASDED